jgi:hypothetical protein
MYMVDANQAGRKVDVKEKNIINNVLEQAGGYINHSKKNTAKWTGVI